METSTIPTYQTGTRLLDLRRGLPGIVVRVTGPDAQGYPVRLDVIWSDASMHHNIPAAVAASWVIRPDTADDEEINAAFAAVVDAMGRKLAEEQTKARQLADAQAAMIAAHPHLEPSTTSTRRGYALAAHNIRQELKRAFPGVKFSVRSSSFSMGNSVDVRWTDGPLTQAVKEITSKYEQGSFDGMDDSYTYNTGEAAAWCDLFGGSKYVMEERSESDAAIAWALDQIVTKWGSDADRVHTVEDFKRGRLYNVSPARHCDDLQRLVRQLIHETDGSAWGAR